MTDSVKSGSRLPLLEMGDRVRVKKRVVDYVTTEISRKAVGIVADVQISAVSGRVLYTVVFAKENEAPSFWGHELVKIPRPAPKAEPNVAPTTPPKLPDDVE